MGPNIHHKAHYHAWHSSPILLQAPLILFSLSTPTHNGFRPLSLLVLGVTLNIKILQHYPLEMTPMQGGELHKAKSKKYLKEDKSGQTTVRVCVYMPSRSCLKKKVEQHHKEKTAYCWHLVTNLALEECWYMMPHADNDNFYGAPRLFYYLLAACFVYCLRQ